jgi:hypothetical protein
MSKETKKKLETITPGQVRDPLFWRGYLFGVVFFSVVLFLHPSASAYVAKIF